MVMFIPYWYLQFKLAIAAAVRLLQTHHDHGADIISPFMNGTMPKAGPYHIASSIAAEERFEEVDELRRIAVFSPIFLVVFI